MSCDKITFRLGHCQHLTVETKLRGIALGPSRSKPIRGRKEVLAQKLKKIVLLFSSKEKPKKVSTGWDISHTNFSVTKPKEGVTPGIKILKKEPDAKTKQKKTVSTKNSPKLLPHILPNIRGYRCVSKEAEKSPVKYIVPQRQVRALSVASPLALSKASQPEEKPLHLVMIGAALFQYLVNVKDLHSLCMIQR